MATLDRRQAPSSMKNFMPKDPFAHVNGNKNRDERFSPYGRQDGPVDPRGSRGMERPKSSARLRSPPPAPPERMDHRRPRPISTGRITRNPKEAAMSVTKTILELRDKREQHAIVRRHPHHSIKQQSSRPPSPWNPKNIPNVEPPQRAVSPHSMNTEEREESFKLKEAEGRIGSLMQELEELRFFHEIDMEPASPSLNKSSSCISPKNESLGQVVQLLSPRKLASMDRTELELEAQKLQRQIEILMHEQASLQAKCTMAEQQARSHSEDSTRIHKLEQAFSDIRSTLIEQLREIQQNRTQLTDDYEAKLESAQKSTRNAQSQVDALEAQITDFKDKYDLLDEEYGHFRNQTKTQLIELKGHWKEKENCLDKQVTENLAHIDFLQGRIADREREIDDLEKSLADKRIDAEVKIKELMNVKDSKIAELEAELEKRNLSHEEFRIEHKNVKSELEQREQRISLLEHSTLTQSETIEALQEQLADCEHKYQKHMDEIKRTFDSREQKRLDELVESQHIKNMEYEDRLIDIRKQLTLATDRHHAEIESKEMELAKRLEKAVLEAKQAVWSEYEPKLKALRDETEAMQKKYDTAMEETLVHQVRAESKDRDTAREWERRDALRQGELERINDKLDRTVRDLAEKESKVQTLTDRLTESEERCRNLLSELEFQQTEEVNVRDEVMNQRTTIAKLKTELARKDFSISKVKEELESKLESLQSELDYTLKAQDETNRKDRSIEDENKNRISNLQRSVENLQKDLISEQSRHESLEAELRLELAKLEGKLSASESTLRDKRAAIEDLEIKLLNANEISSNNGTELKTAMATLRRDLGHCKESLFHAQKRIEEKEEEITRLREDVRKSKESESKKVTGLEEALIATQSKLEDTEHARHMMQRKLQELESAKTDAERKVSALEGTNIAVEEELSRLRGEQEQTLQSLRTISLDKEVETTAVKRVQDDLESQLHAYETEIEKLKEKLLQKEKECANFGKTVATVQANLESAVGASKAKAVEYESLQRRVIELESELAAIRESGSMVTLDSQRSVLNLRRDLKQKEAVQEEMARQLNAVMDERSEAIVALEQMIEEVQLRQEEFDELAAILEKREEELQNAKVIATKALASAKEIKNRYKEKKFGQSEKHADLLLKIDELTNEVEFLTNMSEKMKRKTAQLEAELHYKNGENAKLRGEMRETETKSTQSSHSSRGKGGFLPFDVDQKSGGKMDAFMSRESKETEDAMTGFVLVESGLTPVKSNGNDSSVGSDPLTESYSTDRSDLGSANKWLHNFEEDKSAFSPDDSNSKGASSPISTDDSIPRASPSPRSQRDSLRKFVRKRYMKKT